MPDALAELPEEVSTSRVDPSAGRVRLIPPICTMGGTPISLSLTFSRRSETAGT